MDRRSFIKIGASAFASTGILPLFALDDRQQWYEPEVTGNALLDIPAGLDSVKADKTLAVWRIGHFSDGPEADEPTHPSSFTSAQINFKYPNVGDDLDGMAHVCVYRHDGTVDGKWQRVGSATPSTDWPVVPANVAASSSANWNMGWFAIVVREKPFGTAVLIR